MLMSTMLIHSALFGFMVFFVVVISPTALTALDMAAASRFLRCVFPRLFAFGFAVATIATVTAFMTSHSTAQLISWVSAVFFLINWVVLTPKINAARDQMLAGDTAAKRHFGLLHGASVGLYLVQMIASAVLVILLGRALV